MFGGEGVGGLRVLFQTVTTIYFCLLSFIGGIRTLSGFTGGDVFAVRVQDASSDYVDFCLLEDGIRVKLFNDFHFDLCGRDVLWDVGSILVVNLARFVSFFRIFLHRDVGDLDCLVLVLLLFRVRGYQVVRCFSNGGVRLAAK